MAQLFSNFEINRTSRWPVLSRLLAGSIVLHAVVVAASFYVPAVRDTLNLARVFGDAKYVDADYEKTLIGQRAEIIEFPHDKFQYPEGYFLMNANAPSAEQLALGSQTFIVSAYVPPPPVPVPTPMPQPQRFPKFRPVTVPRALRTPKPAVSPTPEATPAPLVAKNENATMDKPKTKEEAEKELDKVAAANNIVRPDEDTINKRPLKDWLAHAKELKDKGAIKLDGEIEITVTADREPDGKLTNAKIESKSGDESLVQVASDFVSALSDSGVLLFLKDTKHLSITVKLDKDQIVAKVETEADTVQRAKELTNGYNTFLTLGQYAKKGQNEEAIYKNTKISADGKQIIVNFTMPRQSAADMLQEIIKKQETPAT